jgi:hypothetical protein
LPDASKYSTSSSGTNTVRPLSLIGNLPLVTAPSNVLIHYTWFASSGVLDEAENKWSQVFFVKEHGTA